MTVVEARKVVVLGGAGGVGEGIVRVLLEQGAKVGVPTRVGEGESAVRAAHGDHERLVTTVGESLDPVHAASVRSTLVESLGGIDDVVVSIGGWYEGGPLLQDDLKVWAERISQNNIFAHLVAAQTWMPPLLDQGAGSFLLINGSAGIDPFAGAGFVSIAAAAQLMLKDVLVKENQGSGVRINSLVLMTPILTPRLLEGDPSWLSNHEVGTMVAHLLSDAGAATHGESLELGRHDQVPSL